MREIGQSIGSLDFLSSSIDQIIILEQDNWSHEPTDLTLAYQYQQLVTSGDLAVARTEIPIPVKRRNAGQSKMARGKETIGGGLTIAASIADGNPLLLAMYTQTLAPTYHIRGGTGTTYPAVETVVANTADLTTVSAATVADDLSSTRNPVQLTVTPQGTAVTIVNAQDISAGTAVTIAENLASGNPGSTDIEGNLPVTVTLASATLTAAATPGTITIVYNDTAGDSQTAVFTFANNVLTTPQTRTLDIDEVTSITPAGFSAGTVTVATMDPSTVTLATNVLIASIEIWGTDNWDRQIVEEIEWTSSNLLEAQTTDSYFKTVTHVFAANAATHANVAEGGTRAPGWSDGNFGITAQDVAVTATFSPQDQEQVRYWTVEYAKGGKPAVYYGLIATTVAFSIAENTAREDTITFLGRRGEPNTNLAKDTIVYDPNGTTTFPQQTDASALEFADPDVYTGWQCTLMMDGVPQPMQTAEFSMEQGLVDSGIVANEIYNIGPPVRDALRSLTITATVQDSPQMDYWGVFRNGRTIPNVQLVFENNAYGSFPVRESWIFPQAQITASPDPATSGQSRITVNLTIMAFGEGFGNPNDYRVETDLPRYIAPRTYTLSS